MRGGPSVATSAPPLLRSPLPMSPLPPLLPLLLLLLLVGVAEGTGLYATSGIEYEDIVEESAESGSNKILVHIISAEPADGGLAVLECLQICKNTPDCASFVLRPAQKTCTLTRVDRCSSVDKPLMAAQGARTYEVRSSGGATCLATCRATSGCSQCGRNLCTGELCDQCSGFCWQIPSPVPSSVTVFSTPSTRRSIDCRDSWQLAWKISSRFYTELTAVTLKLKVIVTYDDADIGDQEALFRSVSYKDSSLSVGDYTEGTAGNGWGAPFAGRTLVTVPNSNRYDFFYPAGVTTAGGVLTYQEQLDLNYTTITKGYYWYSEDNQRSATRISRITLWVTAA